MFSSKNIQMNLLSQLDKIKLKCMLLFFNNKMTMI